MPIDAIVVRDFERRIAELEEQRGAIMVELAQNAKAIELTREDLHALQDALTERPSAVEFQRFRESMRAKARTPVPSPSEVEFKGPTWLGSLKLSGFSGATIAAVVFTAAVAVVTWLLLK